MNEGIRVNESPTKNRTFVTEACMNGMIVNVECGGYEKRGRMYSFK